jgi:hypothetical protein
MKIVILRAKLGFYSKLLYLVGIITFGIYGSSCTPKMKYGPPTNFQGDNNVAGTNDSLAKAGIKDSLNQIKSDSLAEARKQDSLKSAKRRADSLAGLNHKVDSGRILYPPVTKYGPPQNLPKKYGPRPVNNK